MNTPGPHPEGEKILALLDGELDPAVAGEIREHCAACAPCGQVLREFSEVRGLLAAHAPSEPLRPAWPAVRTRLEAAAAPAFRPAFGFATTAAAVVGIALGVLVGTLAHRHSAVEGTYLWSVVASGVGEPGGGALPDIYATTTSSEQGR
jgi:anti-sigma factor RsiW